MRKENLWVISSLNPIFCIVRKLIKFEENTKGQLSIRYDTHNDFVGGKLIDEARHISRAVESREKLFTRRKARTFIAIINGLLCVYGASTRHDLTS